MERRQHIIDINPFPAPRMSSSDRWKVGREKRPIVARYHAFKDELRLKNPKYILPGVLRMNFIVPMPKSWSEKKKKEMDGVKHEQRPDLDNYLKAFKDTYGEDSHVYGYDGIFKFWGRKGQIILFQ